MPDAFEEQAVLVAAEQAAAEGDATAAEAHLRTLLELQSARLGPDHPEVASTLHNLAVVCERAGRISDAESLYRRAFAAASAALPPTDSLVVRCHEDLNAFLEARLMPVQPAVAGPAVAAPTSRPKSPSSGVRPPRPTSGANRTPARPSPRVPPPAAQASLVPWIAGMVVAAVVVAAAAWWTTRDAPAPPAAARPADPSPSDRAGASRAKTPTSPPAAKATPKAPTTPPPAPTTPPPAAGTPPAQPSSAAVQPVAPATPPAEPAATAPPAAPAEPASTPAASPSVSILTAQLCRELATSGSWTCTPAAPPLSPGRLYYFTRVEVPEATAIEHRWYHGDTLVQSVTLRVRPNSGAGFRTFSRQTVDTRRAGDWRVEVRAPGGAVLAQERFAVQ